ncbi:MAG: hypothetical protein U1A78_32180 [Polyangia bacterium]
MGRKSERREQRVAAARARDRAIIDQARQDPMLLDWMQQSRAANPEAFKRAALHALRTATRPSDPHYREALVALGGLEALAAADALATLGTGQAPVLKDVSLPEIHAST